MTTGLRRDQFRGFELRPGDIPDLSITPDTLDTTVYSTTVTTIDPDDPAAAGSATTISRGDHQHAITAAAATTITGTNSEGVAASFARSDHDHDVALPMDVTGYAQSFTAGSLTTVADTDTWTQIETVSITPVRTALALINASASLRNESAIAGEFSWSARVQVDNADHPVNASAARAEGRIQPVAGQADYGDRLDVTVPWRLTAALHTIDVDFLVTTVSAGDILVRNTKVAVFLIEM